MPSKQQQILAALIAREPQLELDGEVLDLQPGIAFANAVEAESHTRVVTNKVPDLCALCDSDAPDGSCYRAAARQWIEDYMPPLRGPGRPAKADATRRTRRLVFLTTDAEADTILAGVPGGQDFSEWMRQLALSAAQRPATGQKGT